MPRPPTAIVGALRPKPRLPLPSQELFATALDFLKLEKVELGGSRGKVLGQMVLGISEEFHDQWRTIRESKYDPLDYADDVRPASTPGC